MSQEWWGAEEAAQNEVWAAPKPRRAGKEAEREGCALERLADRLLDWFSVLMDDAGAQTPPRDGNALRARNGLFPLSCGTAIQYNLIRKPS